MLLIGPIARYLLAEHGPGYSVWFLEAGHTVLPERLAMMLVRVEAGHAVATICRHSIMSKLKCGATLFCDIFFLLDVWSFITHLVEKKKSA